MEHTIPSFDGCRLHVVTEGQAAGPAVLLSHALGLNASLWDPIVPHLAPRYRIIRYDSRGHGRSDAPQGPYSVEMLARDALAVLDHLEAASVRFVGLSQGGMTGMWLAAHHPDRIQRLVVANSTAFIPAKDMLSHLARSAETDGMSAIGERTIKMWLSADYQAAHPEGVDLLVSTMQSMSTAGYAGAMAMLANVDLRADLAHILCPTLIVAGAEDTQGAPAAAALAQGIAGAKRIDLPAAAHLSPVESPEAFSRAILSFLD